uniref:Uncharacterized protein n=1 Tax=Amphimedon queenslandica TaxID=400682 RepID=A0A1X7UYJ3_AMPQE
MKDAEAFQKLSSEDKHFASKIQGDEIDDQPVSKRMRRMPLHFQDSIVYEVTSGCSILSDEIAEKQLYRLMNGLDEFSFTERFSWYL